MSVSQPFIVRPIATTLLMVAILVFGLVAYRLLPVAALPSVDFPTIVVTANLPGADPTVMASTVAQPLERQFAIIPGVAELTSTSALGTSSITIQFDLDRNIDGAAGDVQAAINAAGGQLPKNLPNPPTYRKVNPADAPVLIMGMHSDVLPLAKVDEYADDNIAQKLSMLKGVSQVLIAGEQRFAVHVQVNPSAMAARNISMDEVATSLSNTTVELPMGTLQGPSQVYGINSNGQILKAEDFNNVIVAYRNGNALRVKDIGHAVSGFENDKIAAWANGKRAMILVIFRQPGANMVAVVESIKARLTELQAAIPPTIQLDLISDRSATVRASIADVKTTLAITVALVVIVIFVFLRNFWATAIPSIAVPLSLVGIFPIMYLLGYSLDNLSLMGLTLAVGFVVDDAIVMIENIVRYLEQGIPAREAALKGAGEIGFTIISITFSLIAVFIPLLFMGGVIGRIFREFAVTVSLAIVMSAFVSLTLTPMMCARFLQDERQRKHGRLYRFSEHVFDGMLALYERGLTFVLRFRLPTLLVTIALMGLTIFLYVRIHKGFFPQEDTGLIYAFTEGAQDVSFNGLYQLQQQAAEIVRADPDVFSMASAIGSGGSTTVSNNGRMFINLKPRAERHSNAEQTIARLRPQLAKIVGLNVYLQSVQQIQIGARLTRTQYQYTLQDSDATELGVWAPKMRDALQQIPGLSDVASDQQMASPQVMLTINRDAASRLGINPAEIENTLYNAFGQRQITNIYTQLNTFKVVLEVEPQFQQDPSALLRIYVTNNNGGLVPMSAVIDEVTNVTSLQVNHQGQFPSVTLSFNLAPGTALSQAVERIHALEQQINKPLSLITAFSGTAEEFEKSTANQIYLIIAAIFAVYVVLGILYESFIHPITILSSLPSAGVGALIALMVCGFDLTIIALIGIILLIGIVKKNAIMMIDFALNALRHEHVSAEEAIYQACILRFRPIMMTTMAALFGSLPIALGVGAGSELRQPLGVAVVGGLLVSQLLTLFTTPVVYLYLEEFSEWLERKMPGKANVQSGDNDPELTTGCGDGDQRPNLSAKSGTKPKLKLHPSRQSGNAD